MAAFLKNPALAGFAGVTSTIVGTALAVALVPADPSQERAMVASGAVLALGLLLVPILRLWEGINVAARAENVLCAALVYWLLVDLLQGSDVLDTSRPVAQLALFAIGLTSVGIWIGAGMRGWSIPPALLRELQSNWKADSIFLASVACFFLGMLSFAIPSNFDLAVMFSFLGESRWMAPWVRGKFGGIDAFWDHLQYFGFVLPTLFVVYWRIKGWFNAKAVLILLMAAVMVVFLAQSGSRRIVGVVVGAALICWSLGSPRLRIGTAIGVVLGAAALLYSLELILIFRGEGWDSDSDTTLEGIRIDDNFLRLAQTIELVPDIAPYVYWRQILYVLVRPIPRLFWPGKPTSPGIDLPDLIGEADISLSTSMIGEWYTMWGFPAVFAGGWFYGRLASFVNEMLARRSPSGDSVVVPVSLMVLFVGVRGLQDLVIMSYAVLGWLLVSGFMHRSRSRRTVPGSHE